MLKEISNSFRPRQQKLTDQLTRGLEEFNIRLPQTYKQTNKLGK